MEVKKDGLKIRKKREDKKIRKTVKEYIETYKLKHKDKSKIVCDICGGSITLFNESHHRNSIKHKKAVELENLKEEYWLMKTIIGVGGIE